MKPQDIVEATRFAVTDTGQVMAQFIWRNTSLDAKWSVNRNRDGAADIIASDESAAVLLFTAELIK